MTIEFPYSYMERARYILTSPVCTDIRDVQIGLAECSKGGGGILMVSLETIESVLCPPPPLRLRSRWPRSDFERSYIR